MHRRSFALPTIMLLAALGCRDAGLPTEHATTTPQPLLRPAPDAAKWIKAPDRPSDISFLTAAVVPNAKGESVLYTFGGNLGTVWAYNATTARWKQAAKIPISRTYFNGATVIKGKVYVAGSSKGSSDFEELYVFDPAANTWTRKADMPSPAGHGVSGAINDRLYVLSQCYECFGPSRFYRYDPATDLWTTLPTPDFVVHYFGSGGTIGGKLYVVGGEDVLQDAGGALHIYDPATGSWSTGPRLLADETAHRKWAAAVTYNAKLYVIGGLNSGSVHRGAVRTVSIFNPATNAWTTGTPLPAAQYGLAAGRILVGGQTRLAVVGGPRPGNHLQYVP